MSTPVTEQFSLKGKVALVTGGAGWLGSAMSEALAEVGATVAAVDVSPSALEALAQSAAQKNITIKPYRYDTITDETQIRAMIDQVAEEHGRLDVLVNCAIKSHCDALENLTSDHFAQTYKNSTAYYIASQQAAGYMRKTGGGAIINIASMYGLVTGYPQVYAGLTPANPLPYQADKAAVLQMTRHTAVYWAKDNIRVNAICPGPFPNTSKAMYAENPKTQEFITRLNAMTPMGRHGVPDEIKGAAVFLASEASGFVTGQHLLVDGGFTTW